MGGKPFTYQTLLDRGNQIHGTGCYDYSKVEFIDRLTKVEIGCALHGSFWQTPAMHTHATRPNGCPVCAKISLSVPKKGDKFTDDELCYLREVHAGRYTYRKEVVHVNGIRHVYVQCKDHGEYLANYHSHRNGAICRDCYFKDRKNTISDVRTRMLNKFGREINITEMDGDVVKFICSQHGEVTVNKNSLLYSNAGCPICANKARNESHLVDAETRISELSQQHNGKYNYVINTDTYNTDTITIVCNEHGEFIQQIKHHKRGQGCPKCANKSITTEDFIGRATETHGDLYSYDAATYESSTTPVAIECPTHGVFFQTPNSHLAGSGCPSCKSSWGESLINEWLLDFKQSFTTNDRSIITAPNGSKFELDFFIPEHNLAIEFNGLYWHSETYGGKSRKYHLDKLEACNLRGIRLFHVFEDELSNYPELVKNKIRGALGKLPTGDGGRKLKIQQISWTTAKEFLSTNHLQGAGSATPLNYGAYNGDGTLVSVMTFGKLRIALGRVPKDDHYELVRFCSDGYTHPGCFTKMLTHFIRMTNPTYIISYADRRWSDGDIYKRAGFNNIRTNPPNYWYFPKGDSHTKRIHRYSMRKDRLRDRADFCIDGLTEYQIALRLGYDRVWDCGTTTWEMHVS